MSLTTATEFKQKKLNRRRRDERASGGYNSFMGINRYFDKKLKKQLWKIDFTLAGQRIRRDGFKNESQASEAIRMLKLRVELNALGLLPPEKPKITLKQLREAQRKDASVPRRQRALVILDKIIELLGGDLQLVEIKKYHLRQVREHFEEKHLSVGTVVNYLGFFSAALHRAPSYFSELNDWQPPAIQRPSRDDGRQRVLTRDELGKLFKELNKTDIYPEVGDALRLMLLTGARRGELKGITIDQINRDWKTFQISKGTKTGLKRVIPLSPAAMAILESREAPLLKSYGAPWFYKLCEKASNRVGLIYGDKVEGGWVPHDLRHTAATVIESAGIKYSTVAALLGHKRSDQTATYTHANLDDLRKAVTVLETWCQDIDGFDVCLHTHLKANVKIQNLPSH